MNYARALGDALRSCLERDPRVLLLGEDIVDPYGGAFKVTRGLSTDFPDRVRSTPISEAALTGVCAGLALRGFRPVLEIMFGDFLTLTFDQLVNHIAKYPAMSGGQATCPVIVRTPSGGGRGYGPTHSQSLEKHLLGVPGLRLVAASPWHPPAEMLDTLFAQDQPVVLVEHKLLYPLQLRDDEQDALVVSHHRGPSGLATVGISAVPPHQCTVTAVAYGYAGVLAARLIESLAIEHEIFVELLVPNQIYPMDWEPIEHSVARTGALVTFEEGTEGASWGTTVAEHLGRSAFGTLRRPPSVVTSDAEIIPSAKHLEETMLLSAERVEAALMEAA
jgi:acetoin:2,6-dichlorophenolindophenol oxidoreductase subunit beta